ncbi:class III extradiol ring-cleavage dioxygenase [Saccharopolyspora sp. NFXS83]|uniref:dioxygenase family protein n=1 Tax=Saccharopolyspora sp. NFXS83 TaxID=2993560 RepID=UPI00224ACC9D|nr:class III extradiol ring-cleavage dioxygenase [Saccharopolyspora sp. NFXS83]MCX2730312.1 class III extradiol ring-cleavage dioxygenase [Saccharopolyspora sp. NFXS83]
MTTPHAEPMPALYLSHGAPPLVDDELWTSQLAAWAGDLPRPRAILVVSAHWESAPLMLGATETGVPLTYDFGGFAERYFRTRYRSPGAPELAAQVAALMPDTEPVAHQPDRGLDHGAYVPLTVMYPDADIPVLQMSLPTLAPEKLLELGRRLRPLRDEGVLIIGSGFTTHGLPFLTEWHPNAAAPGWSQEFDLWAGEALSRGDVDELAAYTARAPGMPYAHPTAEHFAPMFVTLGAATSNDAPPDQTIDGYWMGLAKRSFQVA